jgi:hypothetical protein
MIESVNATFKEQLDLERHGGKTRRGSAPASRNESLPSPLTHQPRHTRLICLLRAYSVTYGIWLGIDPAELRRRFDVWWEPAYHDLRLEGRGERPNALGLLGTPRGRHSARR